MNNKNQAQIVDYELGIDRRYSAARHFPCKSNMSIADMNKLDKDQEYLVNS